MVAPIDDHPKRLPALSKTILAVNSLSGVITLVANVASAFVLSPIMVRELGDSGYGVWEILFGIVGYLGFLDLGVGPAITRHVAVADGAGDNERIRRIVSSSFAFLVGVGSVSAVVLGAIALSPSYFFNVDPQAFPDLAATVLVTAFCVAVEFPAAVVSAHLMGTQRHYFLNGSKTIVVVLRTLSFYFVLHGLDGGKLLGLSIAFLVLTVLHKITITVFVMTMDQSFAISRKDCSWSVVRELYHFGLRSMALMIAQRLRKQTMPILIAHVLGVGQVVYFVIPARLVEYASNLVIAMGFPLTPVFANISARDDQHKIRRAWIQSSRVLQFAILGMALVVAALGEPFVSRWMGPVYASEGRWVLRILAGTLVVEALAPSSLRLLLGTARHGAAAKAALIFSALNVVIAVPAASSWGIAGVALTIVLTTSATTIVSMLLACDTLHLPVREHLRATLWRLRWPALVGAGSLAMLGSCGWSDSYSSILAQGALGLGVYVCSAWFFSMDGAERRGCRDALVQAIRFRLS